MTDIIDPRTSFGRPFAEFSEAEEKVFEYKLDYSKIWLTPGSRVYHLSRKDGESNHMLCKKSTYYTTPPNMRQVERIQELVSGRSLCQKCRQRLKIRLDVIEKIND